MLPAHKIVCYTIHYYYYYYTIVVAPLTEYFPRDIHSALASSPWHGERWKIRQSRKSRPPSRGHDFPRAISCRDDEWLWICSAITVPWASCRVNRTLHSFYYFFSRFLYHSYTPTHTHSPILKYVQTTQCSCASIMSIRFFFFLQGSSVVFYCYFFSTFHLF